MKKFNLLLIVCLLFLLASCTKSDIYTKTEFYAMSTYVSVVSDDEKDMEKIEKYFDNFENRLSRTRSGSEIYELNKNGSAEVSTDTERMLMESAEMSKNTDLAFNHCIGTITELWDITSGNNYVPTDEKIQEAVEKCKVENVSIYDGSVTVKDGTKIDLGAVAKGYALENAMSLCEGENLCINLGGNVAVRGSSEARKKKGESGWLVGITNPFDKSDVAGYLVLDYGFVSVSGAYERNFEKDGEVYHHIFDSKTGRPADSNLASVVVISENGFEADALSTALFVMGKDKAVDFYKKGTYKFDIILITNDGEIYVSKDMYDTFSINEKAKDAKQNEFAVFEID